VPNWLLGLVQSIFARFIWELLLATGVGGLIAGLKVKKEKWAGPVLYGLTAFVLIFVLGFVLTGQAPLHGQPQEVSAENVEDNIKIWADHLAMSLERQPPSEPNFFSYLGRVHQGDPIEIFRAKEKPAYIQLKGALSSLSAEHRAAFAKLSEHDATNFLNQLNLDLTRLKMTVALGVVYDVAKRQPIDFSVAIQKAVPISNLNEGSFAEQFDEVNTAVAQVRAATNLGLGTQTFKAN
jgi:hypothetical protein